MDTLFAVFEPHIFELVGLFLTIVIGFVSRQFYAWTGIEIERRHREALHSALMSGARVAVREGPDAAAAMLQAKAVAYARASVPDAIRALVPGDGVLDALAERYVLEALDVVGGWGPSATSR